LIACDRADTLVVSRFSRPRRLESQRKVKVPHLTEIEVLRFLIQFTLLFAIARILADVMKRLGQATVIGELLSGIVLGPSLLGHLAPAAYRMLFPADATADHLLEAIAWIGVIMLLLYTGLETDLGILRGVGRASLTVSILGIVVPWVSGFALGWELPASFLAAPNQRLIFALFIAVAMSISAVPVIAKILIDLDLMRRDLGLLILAAGIFDDTIGWLMLSIVAGLAAHGAIDLRTLGSILIAVVIFIGFCYYVGGALVLRVMRWIDDRALAEHAGMSAMVGIAMACAIITQAIGIHAVFGAFIAGVMLGRSARLRKSDRTELEATTIGVFAPVFFAYSGLKVDLFTIESLTILGVFIGVAILGKLIGCTAGGLIYGLKPRESLAVAVGMNARGGMGIIVALLGLSLGVLTREMYAIIIVVAILTSLMTPPLLSALLTGIERRPEEAERLEREKLLARVPFSKEGAKLLVLAGGGTHAQLAAHLAAALGNHQDASITVFHATAGESPPEADESFNANFARIKAIAELSGARNIYQRSGVAETIAEAIMKESERGYDAIFAGASPAAGDYALGGEVLNELVRSAQTPVIITRNVGAPAPLRRVLAPITGAPFSRLGATFAMLYAHAVSAQMTAMYVRESPAISFRGIYPGRRVSNEGLQITEEIKLLGNQFGLEIDARVEARGKPENAILAAAERGHFDLLVMGVQFRPAEQHLYFGPKVEHILRNARCAVAVVVTPEPQSRA
jgi:Kef-type K+ transport system membrane component KefB/nucleotide-binding universal stress UspA family protein